MTKKMIKYAVVMFCCVATLIGIKANDFLVANPECAWWHGLLAGIGYVAILFIAVALLIGLVTWWIEK